MDGRPPPWQADGASSLPDLAPFKLLIKRLSYAKPMAIRRAAATALTSLSAPKEQLQECKALLRCLSTSADLSVLNQVVFREQARSNVKALMRVQKLVQSLALKCDRHCTWEWLRESLLANRRYTEG